MLCPALRGSVSARAIAFSILGASQMSKGQRKANGSVELAETPSHLMRRCHQFYGDLYARESGDRNLTKQQYLVLCALEQHDGVSQTSLVETTGIDRSTLAEMIRRMLERGVVSRKRADEDGRANTVVITQAGKRVLRAARLVAEKAERALLEPLPAPERLRFVKLLAMIAAAADEQPENGGGKAHRKPTARRA
jgi:DNA-binding MarR family transcriptional regulator